MSVRWPGNAQREKTSFGNLSRSELMARVRRNGNKTTELRMIKMLRESRITGWRRHLQLPGNPDFAWPNEKVALFVDGCFWHGHDCNRNLTPKRNAELWRKKIARTIRRDRQNSRKLRDKGWSVIRVWECKLAKNPTRCVGRIERAVRPRAA